MARTQPAEQLREEWSGQLGFVFAAIGSAVGLGNIWRFPGVAYENGGGAFLIPYLVALLTAGIPILLLDYAIGHRYRGSAPTSFRRMSRPAESLGWFQVGICMLIAMYYTAILAWAGSYAVFSFGLRWGDDPGTFLMETFLQVAPEPGVSFEVVPGLAGPLAFFWLVAIGIIALGVRRGIEKANLVFMPLLIVMFLAIVIWSVTLDGAAEGLNAFFTPDFGALRDPQVWLAAYAQIFFSLSIAFGIMITYSSYLARRANLTTTGLTVGFANSSFELLAGIGVFSALGFMAAAQGITVGELEGISGVGLAFVAFPQILTLMPGGQVFGVLFFLSLTVAALTSLISILEVVCAAFQEKLAWSRRRAVLVFGGGIAVLSMLLYSTTTTLYVLDTVDKYVNEIGIVGSAVVMTVLVGFLLRRLPVLQLHLNGRTGVTIGAWWRFFVGLLVPVVLGYMFVTGIRTVIREPYGDYPWWFLDRVGWGAIGAILLLTVVMTRVRWRRDVDRFVPYEVPGLTTVHVRTVKTVPAHAVGGSTAAALHGDETHTDELRPEPEPASDETGARAPVRTAGSANRPRGRKGGRR